MVGDFFGDRDLVKPSLVAEFECQGGDVVDLEGGLAMGLGSRAFSGELELLLGCLVLGVDFNGSEGLDRFRSRSLKNLGKDGFFAVAPWSPEKSICHALDSDWDVNLTSSLFRVPLEGGSSFACSKSTVNDRFLDIPAGADLLHYFTLVFTTREFQMKRTNTAPY